LGYSVLKNKNAFITGASGGLGREIAIELAGHGSNLYLTGRNTAKLKQVKAALASSNTTVELGTGDLRLLDDVNAIIADADEKMSGIDILVNCAGVFPTKTVAESTLADLEDCLNINVRAPFLLCKAFVEGMVERRWGRIVNIGSSSAYSGFKGTSIYCASKHALLGLSRSWHDEFKEHNVRTFCISPGSIKTEMGKKVTNQDFETFMDPKEIAEYISFVISFDAELISEEVRLNRMVIQ
jgi:NAD(P)-dependent dehydrogenase (short-subunit alcohol dehydrogenase family)